jgi:putative transposase
VSEDILSDERLEIALWRYDVVRQCLDDEAQVTKVAAERQIARRTIHYWISRYKQEGLHGLARKSRKDGGSRRTFCQELEQLVRGFALQRPQVSHATIYRKIKEICINKNQPAPSYRTVYNIIREIPPALSTLALEGTKAYKDRFDLLHRQEALHPNSVWQADHTMLDLYVREGKRIVRPWLTIIEDDYSRIIAGYSVSLKAPSAIHTALALRQAIWQKGLPGWQVCGIPLVLYVDHGSDFTSRHLERAGIELKIRLIFSRIGEPRGRGKIERFFNTVNQVLLSRLPGYAPDGHKPKGKLLSLSELEMELQRFIVEEYNLSVHSGTGESPRSRWLASNFIPMMPESIDNLDVLLLTCPTSRVVHQDGIRFQGRRYISIDFAGIVGETVTIRYDPRDLSQIRVYSGEKFCCYAACPELGGDPPSLQLIIKARTERHDDLKEVLREHKKHIADSEPKPHSSGQPRQRSHKEQKAPVRLKLYECD